MPEAARRRPPPVADAPVADLADGRLAAKAWLVALVDDAPLDRVDAISAATIAAEGPALCAAVVAALASDPALDALPAAAAGAGRIAGARDPAAVVGSVECLRGAVRDLVRERVAAADESLLARLHDRLAHVCAIAAAAAASSEHEATPARREPGAREAIERRIAEGRPFGLVAVEVDELERLRAVRPADELDAALGSATSELRARLAAGAELIADAGAPGRVWAIADPGGARAVAAQATAVLAERDLHASAGVARFPVDGDTAAALTARADERLFSARAAGVPVTS